jgi:hypothetical protein
LDTQHGCPAPPQVLLAVVHAPVATVVTSHTYFVVVVLVSIESQFVAAARQTGL